MGEQALTFHVVSSGKPVTLTYSDTSLTVKGSGKLKDIPFHQLIQADFHPDTLTLQVSYVWRKKTKGNLSLVRIEGTVKESETSAVKEWADNALKAAFENAGVKRGRRVKVLVNPHGGTRKGAAIFTKTVEPVLRAGGCMLDIQYTTHSNHAYEISKVLPLEYDAIITVSGDGLIHEVMNGFAHHEYPMKAFSIPIAPIPTGSGNGLSVNILGLADGFDVVAAALNVIKGLPMKVDVFSFVQNGKRSISFMSQAMGLMADLDLGTEHLRWMGDTRFVYGLLRGLVTFKPCAVQFSYKVAEEDKDKMAQECYARRVNDKSASQRSIPTVDDSSESTLPPLTAHDSDEGWITFDKPLLYLYAGKGPFVGRDFMAFPVSLPDDGLIDIVAQTLSSRGEVIHDLAEGPKGGHFWKDSLHYIKAHAYRMKPLSPKGSLSVDGEIFPFEAFEVEVHQKLATLLSPHGYYAADFHPRESKST
ncbi:ATP-NAD kinase-like domain-containing protein [Desarmillaria tabescens]|uniref:ATP-NAD kinase-like domain-containing protein n=1 Tax=Armillaria tabescens TaxID=1929756 RepID=A0AA39NE20_ARMTA|nr:ATP-NAD kinase-like domain-containing protein [Desarmillaria tabescens]KAK0463936.1 ATP-NAD kinase-like domain-containing protein [Desarmillaria tabescens]